MNLFGISSVELVIVLVVVVLVLGPSGFAQAMRAFRRGVELVRTWSARLREEAQRDSAAIGLEDLDLSSLDLRQYDPREIVRQAVREEMDAWMKQGAAGPGPKSDLPPGTGR